jgi:ATP-dependent DNA helicase RecQ
LVLRPLQASAIEAVLDGRDALVLLPTGGGKSLCYQLPARALAAEGHGPTLLVSPLLALMRDQVAAAEARGLRAVRVGSDLSAAACREALAAAPSCDLLVASPERVASARMRAWLRTHRVARVAVDEAHCVSEWGHDFRPEYAALGFLRSELGLPVLALTATATPRVRLDIAASLGLNDPLVLVGALRRPSLALSVESPGRGRAARVRALLDASVDGRAIVYAPSRARVVALAASLRAAGIDAVHTHAGRTVGARDKAETAFVAGRRRVLVATSAFGMGVDLPDVRLVVHAGAPPSLEAWWQQAGRAGRDGRAARAVLLWSEGDRVTLERLVGTDPARRASFEALVAMVRGRSCRVEAVEAHFGVAGEGPCGLCDACRGDRPPAPSARPARPARVPKPLGDGADEVVLRLVAGMKRPVGRTTLVAALRGSRGRTVVRRGLPGLPGFGALAGSDPRAVLGVVDALLDDGRLERRGRKYPTVWLAGRPVRGPRVARTKPAVPRPVAELVAWRRRQARLRRWRPYQVFPDAVLNAIAARRPETIEALLEIPGMGPRRVARWGDDLLALVARSGAEEGPAHS